MTEGPRPVDAISALDTLVERAIRWLRPRLPTPRTQGAIGAVVLVAVLIVYLGALFESKAGEVAGALGSVVGGLVGAGGAVWAVYLALSRQRAEEAAKVASSVRTEVLNLTKYVIGAVEVCVSIQNGTTTIPRSDASDISKNFSFDPVVYPAVADRVGLLPHPEATVGFYMRIAEAKAMLEMMAKAQPVSAFMNVSMPPEKVGPADALSVADCLITALQLAGPIIVDDVQPEYRLNLDNGARKETLRQIDECLVTARTAFPGAESFREPPPA